MYREVVGNFFNIPLKKKKKLYMIDDNLGILLSLLFVLCDVRINYIKASFRHDDGVCVV